jgi:hypothetical protein
MSDIDRRRLLKGALSLGVLGAVGRASVAHARRGSQEYRWDLVNVLSGCVEEGGIASARAQDGSRITVSGSGTFRDGPGHSQNVTGGGDWTIVGPAAGPSGSASGMYEVTHFVSFTVAPGTAPLPDCIGDAADARAGLLTVGIEYSDSSEGVLVVSCHLVGTPDSVAEGISASKGFVDFWAIEPPVAGVEGNRTLFHVLP